MKKIRKKKMDQNEIVARWAYDNMDVSIHRELIMDHQNEFWAYIDMHRRCYDETHPKYSEEGANGIEVCKEWHMSNPSGFPQFLEDVGPMPK